VLIIGAGIAGICAARDLLQQGFDVQVIEARDRIGGRIAPAKNFSVPIDIGAR
jgi:monoamine oxidase